MGYTNSGLVAYTKLSTNHSGQRTHSIDRITPHCAVGQCSAEGLGDWFAKPSTRASSNYGIDKDGRVGLYVEEKNCSWCSSSSTNDQRAVTIECASDATEPYAFRDAVYQKLIVLCVDICKRNGKKKLLWLKDKDRTLAYEPASDEMVLTVHRWFANKSCPGNWLMERMGDLAARVTAQLGGETAPMKAGLRQGDKGTAVTAMQKMLIACGCSCGPDGADGDFGKNTLAGLTAFQKAAGLTVDGVYGEADEVALRKAFAAIPVTTPLAEGKNDEHAIWDTLNAAIGNAYGTAGLMGNLYAESALKASNLQNTGNRKLDMTDEQYTEAVDNGSYDADAFIHDGYGYGIAQWTYYSRKAALLSYALDQGKSIGDLKVQLDFLLKEIQGYTSVWNTLRTAASVREASDAVLLKFERPADQSEAVQVKRAGYGKNYFDKFATALAAQEGEQKTTGGIAVTAAQAKYINSTGTHYISNSGHDENNAYKGGQAGDQTGTEWQMRSWYSRPWTCVLRYPDQAVALKIALLGIDAALNDRIGYDQGQNRTYLAQLKVVGWEPSRIAVACEADCSAGVCANVTAAGYLLGIAALKNHTGTYTGNMRSALKKAGFQVLTDSKYLTGGDYLLPGDILLNDNHHTATNVTIGKKVRGDWNPGTAPAQATTYYRVRKNWNDAASQIAAYTVLENAKLAVDTNPGYAVFDENGKQLYPFVAYRVEVSIPDLNYREGPDTSYASYGYIEPGIYTIVDEQDGWGLLKAYADRRNGWIKLSYTKKI